MFDSCSADQIRRSELHCGHPIAHHAFMLHGRRLVAVLWFGGCLTAVTAAGVYSSQCGGPSKNAEVQREQDAFEAKGRDATFIASYNVTFGSTNTGHETVYQRGASQRREDDVSPNGTLTQTFIINGTQFNCGFGGVPTCITEADRVAALLGKLPAPLSLGTPGDLGLALKSVHKGRAPGLSRVQRSISGEPSTCFRRDYGDFTYQQCYTIDGIVTETSYDYPTPAMQSLMDATSIRRDGLTDADFQLPYPVVKPSAAPETPVSPPSSP